MTRVNIVWNDLHGERIIDRLARHLAELTGWALNERPDPSADFNYSMLYIDLVQRFSDWRKTPWAAYFSHRETGQPYKEFWWDECLPLTKAQTFTADQYGARLPNAIKVVPPIDPMFCIRERQAGKLPVIGVSGFAAKTARKNPAFVARLAELLEGRADMVASGDGWPLRHINRSFSGLPAFYNILDLYLCTATIEGVPMPPLEALRCGTPVVIPRGVGMLDELPDARGIWRYNAGDFDGMAQAVEFALDDLQSSELDREALAATVARFTPEAWADSHQALLGAMNGGAAQVDTATPRVSHDRHGSRGVYYVAYGEQARKCAAGAIASFKQHLPDIPVALASDTPLGPEDIFINHPDEDIGGRMAKVKIYDLAPDDWAYVCYLDADTEVTAAERLLWQVVEDGWDMVICKNPARFHIASQMRRSDNGDECDYTFGQLGTDQLIQLNGGVFAFQRNERTKAFFHTWHQEWMRYGKRDQAALLRALFKSPVKLYVLGNEWNTIFRYDSAGIAAWLLHYPMNARRWRGTVHYRLDDPKAWEAVRQFEKEQKKEQKK